ncbi:FixH family protein [Asticcacaulis sp. BYS171W]|uniref:FixH family protein n=1 Tax=Asticcacaulis aquaticus TaxID=2984212 RepID=A0ABT5HYW1_9CAUL|nr:FixH family protein [Asticcacaulis aquaticus]MDC7685270.1 FixH family protein [Asticcacaulis aquaticus]
MTAISSAETQAEIDRRRGRFVPWIIAAFFLSFMLPLIAFTVLAFRHAPSEVTPQAYEKGLAYNSALAAEAAQAGLGWRIAGAYDHGAYHVTVRDDDRPLEDARVEVWFVHPAQKALDRHIVLTAQGDGIFSAPANLPVRAGWTAHVTVEDKGRQVQTRFLFEN